MGAGGEHLGSSVFKNKKSENGINVLGRYLDSECWDPSTPKNELTLVGTCNTSVLD